MHQGVFRSFKDGKIFCNHLSYATTSGLGSFVDLYEVLVSGIYVKRFMNLG